MGDDVENPIVSNKDRVSTFRSSLNVTKTDDTKKAKMTFTALKELLIRNRKSVIRAAIEKMAMIGVFIVTAVYYSRQKIVSYVPSSQCNHLCKNDGGTCQYSTVLPAQDILASNFVNIAFRDISDGAFLGYSFLTFQSIWYVPEVINPPKFEFLIVSAARELYLEPIDGPASSADYNYTFVTFPTYSDDDVYANTTWPADLYCFAWASEGYSSQAVSTIDVYLSTDSSPNLQVSGVMQTIGGSAVSGLCNANVNGVNIPLSQFSNVIVNSDVAQCTTHTNTVAYIGTGFSYALTVSALITSVYYCFDLYGNLFG